ncbi:hypothetical protein LO80_06800 [Candidatus Francisella endociliophora]|uniref:Lipoprotein n=1 Tax=Candidatus Francisella endociliophora TaxID=653937 RepID=A0A097EQ46_9GAMM|nr:hypothetical protein [Francisella sp. FSC1006]AIT09699.1 hypothetical protein LO80_06800 [Francisella sp. FSC1006]
MKKKILGLSVLVGSALLVGCTDPSKDNSSVLQNQLIIIDNNPIMAAILGAEGINYDTSAGVGINQSSIPGFENNGGAVPTPVTVTVSNISAGCGVIGPNVSSFTIETTANANGVFSSLGVDSFFVGLGCGAGGGTANATISFTAGGKSYTATTTLTAQ